jgi:hypothetical protein
MALSKTGKANEYAYKLYMAMLMESTKEELPQPERGELATEAETREVRVYRGRITETYKSLGISQSYYTRVRDVLTESGSIEYLQQGARGVETVIVLHHAPPEDFTFKRLTAPPTPDKLAVRLNELEAWRDTLGNLNLQEALRNIEYRLSQLEEKSQEPQVVT